MGTGVGQASSPDALVSVRKKVRKKSNFGLTKRVKLALDVLVWGYEEELVDLKRAGEIANLSERSLRDALARPTVLKYYREQLTTLREGGRAANIRTAIEIRDDRKLKDSIGGQRVRLQAAAMLDQDIYSPSPTGVGSGNAGVTVNIVAAGYVFDMRTDASQPIDQIDHLATHTPKLLIPHEDVPE